MKLLLTRGGTAELYEDESEEELVWASDADPDWSAKCAIDFLGEDQIETIIDFLIAEDYLTDEDADALDIEEESLTEDPPNTAAEH